MIDCDHDDAANMTRRDGFTLIELLATLLLATVLAITVLTVLGGVGRAAAADRSIDQEILSPSRWADPLVDRIRSDLIDARTLRIERDGFSLDGYDDLGSAGGPIEHLPVHVRYQLRSLGGRSCLLRTQSRIGKYDFWRGLACVDVAAISLTKLDLPPVSPLTNQATAALWTVPPRVRLRLQFAEASAPPIDRILVLRDSP